MMLTADIEKLIREKIPGTEVSVRDLTGTMDHFEATIISKSFEGLGLVQQHQMVYAALKEPMQGPIHALKLNTYSTSDWEKRKGK